MSRITEIFAVLPYLKTSASVRLRGLNFRNSQDLARDFEALGQLNYNWALIKLLAGNGDDPSPLESRLFTALEWQNRACARNLDEGVALMFLAIAFESLLNLDQGEELAKRFKESVTTLIGPVPRLDSWLEQFYKARSGIVHKGNWPHLKFYPVDKESLGNIYKGKEEALVYRSLISYGRRVFRACLNAIVSGSQLAHETQLSALFVHNQERLERICQKLSNTSLSAEQRIRSVRKDIVDLHSSWFEAESRVKDETIVGAARLLVAVFLETNPSIPEHDVGLLKDAIGSKSDESDMQFEKYIKATGFSHDRQRMRSQLELERSEEPIDIVQLFRNYMFTHRSICSA